MTVTFGFATELSKNGVLVIDAPPLPPLDESNKLGGGGFATTHAVTTSSKYVSVSRGVTGPVQVCCLEQKEIADLC